MTTDHRLTTRGMGRCAADGDLDERASDEMRRGFVSERGDDT